MDWSYVSIPKKYSCQVDCIGKSAFKYCRSCEHCSIWDFAVYFGSAAEVNISDSLNIFLNFDLYPVNYRDGHKLFLGGSRGRCFNVDSFRPWVAPELLRRSQPPLKWSSKLKAESSKQRSWGTLGRGQLCILIIATARVSTRFLILLLLLYEQQCG